jgi:type IX secretion system PorP/SprF family membrane protein
MKSFFRYMFLLVVGLQAWRTEAQQLPVMHHYLYNRFLLNPAATGATPYANFFVTHRRQWDKMPDAPVTNVFTADANIKDTRFGVGGQLFTDETHILTNVGGMASFAYHLPFNAAGDHRLSLGLSVGAVNKRIDFANATVAQPNDLALLGNNANQMYIDASAGIQYQYKGLTIGVAVPQIAGNGVVFRQQSSENVQYRLARHYLGMASYKLQFGEEAKGFSVEPVAMMRYVEGLPFQLEANVLAGWRNMLFVGGGYRLADASTIAATAGFRLKDKFTIAYSIETGGQNASNLGMTHEITIGYRFPVKNKDLEALKKRVDTLAQAQKMIKQDLNKVKEGLDTLRQSDSLQNAEIDKLQGDAAKIKQLQDQMAQREREIKELRELIDKNKQPAGGNFKYKKLGDVFFAIGKSELDAKANASLEAISPYLARAKEDQSFAIYLNGNASLEGSSEYNFALSIRRAVAVKNYLIARGVPADQVIVLPHGEEHPINKQGNEAERAKNRRVDIFVAETK